MLAALAGVWIANQPFDAKVGLNEVSAHNTQLPPLENAVVSLTLHNETKIDTIPSIDSRAVFTNIPHRFLNKEAHITLTCPNYLPLDTTVVLDRDLTLDIRRDPAVFGNVHFSLWNPATETFIPNVPVDIAGHRVTSDANGLVEVFIPLEEQSKTYLVKAPFALEPDSVYLPCGENDVMNKK